MYYHMLANQRKTSKEIPMTAGKLSSRSFEAQRTWFWFPLFSFFESGIDGKIPNEFQWPLTVKDVKDAHAKVESFFTIRLARYGIGLKFERVSYNLCNCFLQKIHYCQRQKSP